MTMTMLVHQLVHLFHTLGAPHVYAKVLHDTGYVATKHFLVIACKIPAGHGTFYCSGQVTR